MKLIALTLLAAGAASAAAFVPEPHATRAPARVVVTVDWQTDITAPKTKDPLPYPEGHTAGTPGPDLFEERGSVRILLDVDPMVLPGGPMSKQVASSGSKNYMLGIANGMFAIPAGGGTIVSVTGDVTYEHKIEDRGSCRTEVVTGGEMAGKYLHDAATLVTKKKFAFTKSNTMLNLRFVKDTLTSISIGAMENVALEGRITYACPSAMPVARTEDLGRTPGSSVSLDPKEKDGFKLHTSLAGGVRRITGASEKTDKRGYKVVRSVTVTYAASGGSAPPPVVSTPTLSKPTTATGTITFTQGTTPATWKLSGSDERGGMGVMARVLTFTPTGTQPTPNSGVLVVTVLDTNGTTSVAGLAIDHGPAGDSEYDMATSGCRITITKPTGGGVNGNGTCTTGFTGPAVPKFSYTLSK